MSNYLTNSTGPNPRDDQRIYEVHVRDRDQWRVIAVFDDAELALFDARTIQKRRRGRDVRVVQERWCTRSNLFLSRTVYSSAYERDRVRRLAGQCRLRAQPLDGSRSPAADASAHAEWRRGRLRRETHPFRVVLTLLGLTIVAAGGLYALELLHRMT
jgi:hypothetical protein